MSFRDSRWKGDKPDDGEEIDHEDQEDDVVDPEGVDDMEFVASNNIPERFRVDPPPEEVSNTPATAGSNIAEADNPPSVSQALPTPQSRKGKNCGSLAPRSATGAISGSQGVTGVVQSSTTASNMLPPDTIPSLVGRRRYSFSPREPPCSINPWKKQTLSGTSHGKFEDQEAVSRAGREAATAVKSPTDTVVEEPSTSPQGNINGQQTHTTLPGNDSSAVVFGSIPITPEVTFSSPSTLGLSTSSGPPTTLNETVSPHTLHPGGLADGSAIEGGDVSPSAIVPGLSAPSPAAVAVSVNLPPSHLSNPHPRPHQPQNSYSSFAAQSGTWTGSA